jgi:hypothetical protein
VDEGRDFRTERSESPEGGGHARAAWNDYHHPLFDDPPSEAFGPALKGVDDFPDDVVQDIAERVVEDSELIGFWIAWHQAGGFANLQAGGWARSTIFRRLRAFRTRYGVHPDEYRFDWIALDLAKTWQAGLRRVDDPDELRDERA